MKLSIRLMVLLLALCHGAAQGAVAFSSSASPLPRSRMVIAHNPKATSAFQPREDLVRAMVRRSITNLTGRLTPTEAWRSLVTTQDVVGIKVHSAPGAQGGTRSAVVAAVIADLIEAGMPRTHIIVWDRRLADLRAAGYGALASQFGIQLAGSVEAGFDENSFYEAPLLGNLVWGDHEFGRTGEGIGRKSFVTKLVTKKFTRIISIAPLLNHNTAGVAGHLYSLAIGSIDNSLRFESEAERLAYAVPDVYNLPALGSRVVLNITDALICQYLGEQRSLLHYSVVLNELRFSTDPVALDTLSMQELDQRRKAAHQSSNLKATDLYQNAGMLQLGVSDPGQILVERLEN